ncbi:hypothetical protein BZG36_01241 [Bifiguratus adelaidae]|uniref:TRIP4/RQT4 C2HC5-type zinc finger domain-containing protein n=1 Tax=Bifiguratus adelaidae TaxID=1938954 RepID=A0A261Y5M6_9FUNG|nr:hypothetical protein BZG36_01241 [Bifiguratus adelaidae]
MSVTGMDAWAETKLVDFLGFDHETVRSQLLPYLNSLGSKDALTTHLLELLGSERADFIQEFASKLFPERKSKPATPPSTPRSSTPTKVPETQPEVDWKKAFGNEKNVYRKKDVEDDYFIGKRSHKKADNHGNASSNEQTSGTVTPQKPQTPEPAVSSTTTKTGDKKTSGQLVSDKLEKKKKKHEKFDAMSLEKALKELELQGNVGSKRRACDCQAQKHDLFIVAPNCLNCGKIICVQEGAGPCTFCNTPIISKEQQLELIAEAKRKRALVAQEKARQFQKKSTAAVSGRSIPYASKLSGQVIIPSPVESDPDESLRKAERHKETLLEYDRTSAARTRVIDQATDFAVPTDRANLWLSPQERALEEKKQNANIRKLTNANKRKVMTLDLTSKKVIMQEVDNESSESEEEDARVAGNIRKLELQRQRDAERRIPLTTRTTRTTANQPQDLTSSRTYAENPFLNHERPQFIRSVTRAVQGGASGDTANEANQPKANAGGQWTSLHGESSHIPSMSSKQATQGRVQYDSLDGMAEGLLIGGEDGSREHVIVTS